MIEKLQKRRSIRKYTGEDVPEEKLRRILSAGLLSPTSKNLHPWEFLVIQDKRTLEKLADCRDKGADMLKGEMCIRDRQRTGRPVYSGNVKGGKNSEASCAE